MPDSLIEEFEVFFIGLPRNVRDDLSFMMVILSDEDLEFHDAADVYNLAAETLFSAKTQIGRISQLINAVSILDIYFAMDVQERFGTAASRSRSADRRGAGDPSRYYSNEIDAIMTTQQRWRELRSARFTPEAIAQALAPANFLSRQSPQLFRSPTADTSVEARP